MVYMLKKTTIIIVSLAFIAGATYWIYQKISESKNLIPPDNGPVVDINFFKPLDATYIIEEDSVTLINGKAEKEISSGSASKIEVAVWGEPDKGDLTGDGISDAALVITYSAGGSGTFYYIAAALNGSDSGKTVGTNAILLGDRIAPQNISISDGEIIINYADRKKSEPMIIQPSIGITRRFRVENSSLKETTPEEAVREYNCAMSGGSIKDSLCCKSASDFPNSCLIGACGCSPGNSHEVKVCDCGIDKCFDGRDCSAIKNN
jgi:hypothetical protein